MKHYLTLITLALCLNLSAQTYTGLTMGYYDDDSNFSGIILEDADTTQACSTWRISVVNYPDITLRDIRTTLDKAGQYFKVSEGANYITLGAADWVNPGDAFELATTLLKGDYYYHFLTYSR